LKLEAQILKDHNERINREKEEQQKRKKQDEDNKKLLKL
jgi:hypothetical protein